MNKLTIPNEVYRPSGQVTLVLMDTAGKIKDVQYYKNLVTDAGKAAIADGLRGTTSGNKGIITYFAVGTDATAPAAANTTLGAEIFRKLVSVRTVSDNVATFETFLTTAEGNGTLKEAGLFGDSATATADSGTLFCHAAINRTKTSNDTLIASWAVTIG